MEKSFTFNRRHDIKVINKKAGGYRKSEKGDRMYTLEGAVCDTDFNSLSEGKKRELKKFHDISL